VARFLVGADSVDEAGNPNSEIIDIGHRRELDVAIELPKSPLEAVMSNEVWEEIYHRLAELIQAHRTTLVFVNTRRMAERVTHHLSELLGADAVLPLDPAPRSPLETGGAERQLALTVAEIDRDRFVNRGLNGPAPFAGVLNEPGVLGERGIFRQRDRGQVEPDNIDPMLAKPIGRWFARGANGNSKRRHCHKRFHCDFNTEQADCRFDVDVDFVGANPCSEI
jgi:hypothetical protein